MGLTNYVSAMDCWKGRIDSTTDYDAFRWHQWVQPLDLNIQTEKPECELGFAFIGFCSEQGVKRNKGRVGTALAPDFIRAQMSIFDALFYMSNYMMPEIFYVTRSQWKKDRSCLAWQWRKF